MASAATTRAAATSRRIAAPAEWGPEGTTPILGPRDPRSTHPGGRIASAMWVEQGRHGDPSLSDPARRGPRAAVLPVLGAAALA